MNIKCRTCFAQRCLFLYATVRNSVQDSRNKKLCCKPWLNMWDPLHTIPQLSFAAMLIFTVDPCSFFNKLCYHAKSCWSAVCIQWRQQGKRMFSSLQYFASYLKLQAQSNMSMKFAWNTANSSVFFPCNSQDSVNTKVSWHKNTFESLMNTNLFRQEISLKSSFYQRFNLNSSFCSELYRRCLWRTWPALHHLNI